MEISGVPLQWRTRHRGDRQLLAPRSPADERIGDISLSNPVREDGGNPFPHESNHVLSKLLRKEAAIEGVARKAVTGTSTRRLWPKAVLEALDDAVTNDRWESALQVSLIYLKIRFSRFLD